MRWFVTSLHDHDWLTVYILSLQAVLFLVQAGIFIWQGFILRHHGDVMDKQAETAQLISQALAQQGTILADQTKIMSAQFDFEKVLHANAERKAIFDMVFALVVSVRQLAISLQDPTNSNEVLMQTKKAWADMKAKASSFGQALLACQYMSNEELTHLKTYFDDVIRMEPSASRGRDAQLVEAFEESHKDFLIKTRTTSG
jgi:hypothetical protein